MADPAAAPDMPDAAAIANFLRRFADLMSTGQNAAYLHQAARLLETLTARLSAAADEERLWQYKYTTVVDQADMLEAERDSLKQDIDGHLEITSSLLAERDELQAALRAREEELTELREVLAREQDQDDRDGILAELRDSFDQEREAFKATIEERINELSRAFELERTGLLVELKASGDELAAVRDASRREHDEFQAKIVSLESERDEIRAAFERIGDLQNQTIEQDVGIDGTETDRPDWNVQLSPALEAERDHVASEGDAVVPRATLRQARAQFEYLAKECVRRGDIASQVMCELGVHILDQALSAGGGVDDPPIGEMAASILAGPDPDNPDNT
jgi:chromosome segregation ATPase